MTEYHRQEILLCKYLVLMASIQLLIRVDFIGAFQSLSMLLKLFDIENFFTNMTARSTNLAT